MGKDASRTKRSAYLMVAPTEVRDSFFCSKGLVTSKLCQGCHKFPYVGHAVWSDSNEILKPHVSVSPKLII